MKDGFAGVPSLKSAVSHALRGARVVETRRLKLYNCAVERMRALRGILCALLFVVCPKAAGQEAASEGFRTILSFDTAFFISSLQDKGFGAGIVCEHLVLPFLSATGGFSAGFQEADSESGITCITVGVSLGANFYPFSMGLERLYLGFAVSTDFQNYEGDIDSNDTEDTGDTVTSLTFKAGWKQLTVHRKLMVDLYGGWKVIVHNSNNWARNEQLVSKGLVVGFRWALRQDR